MLIEKLKNAFPSLTVFEMNDSNLFKTDMGTFKFSKFVPSKETVIFDIKSSFKSTLFKEHFDKIKKDIKELSSFCGLTFYSETLDKSFSFNHYVKVKYDGSYSFETEITQNQKYKFKVKNNTYQHLSLNYESLVENENNDSKIKKTSIGYRYGNYNSLLELIVVESYSEEIERIFNSKAAFLEDFSNNVSLIEIIEY